MVLNDGTNTAIKVFARKNLGRKRKQKFCNEKDIPKVTFTKETTQEDVFKALSSLVTSTAIYCQFNKHCTV